MAILHAHHIALRTPHFERAKAFYTGILGFPIKGQLPGANVVFIDIGGTTIELVQGPVAEDYCPLAAASCTWPSRWIVWTPPMPTWC